MNPLVAGRAGPSDRQLRTRGALIAAGISSAWLAASAFVWALPHGQPSVFHDMAGIVAIGILAAVPASAAFGWTRAIAAIGSRDESMEMAAGVVVWTDLEISVGFGVLQGIYFALHESPGDLVGGLLYAALFGFLAFVFGTLVFVLPGLALAIPSGRLWQRAMRRGFATR